MPGTGEGGSVFKITTNNVVTVLYDFPIGPDSQSLGRVGARQRRQFLWHHEFRRRERCGTVFQINSNGVMTILYSFTGGSDGDQPNGGLVQGKDSSFYGTSARGGLTNLSEANGTVFRITTNGVLVRLHEFTGENDDGELPQSGLVLGRDGNYYGTTTYGR